VVNAVATVVAGTSLTFYAAYYRCQEPSRELRKTARNARPSAATIFPISSKAGKGLAPSVAPELEELKQSLLQVRKKKDDYSRRRGALSGAARRAAEMIEDRTKAADSEASCAL
jgi:hypothetical protein